MGYSLTAEQREIIGREVDPGSIDAYINQAWELGGDVNVEAKISAFAKLPPTDYAEMRRREYASIGDQLDMQYHDSQDGTTTWVDHVRSVKAAHPKPE